MWTAFELTIDFIQAMMMLLFMKSRLHISRRRMGMDVLCVLTITAFFAIYEWIALPIPDVTVFGIPLIYSLVVANDKWYVSLFWTLVLGMMFMAAVSLSLHLFMSVPRFSYSELMADTDGRIIFVLATNVIIFLFLFASAQLKKEVVSPAWPALFLTVNLTLIVVEEAAFSLQMALSANVNPGQASFFLIYIGVFLCTFFSIFMFHMMAQSAARENRYKIEASAMALSQQHMQELKRLYIDLQAQQHDFRQHYQTLEEMVRQGGNAEAVKYLTTYHANLSGREAFLTGCMAVDALLTAKYLTILKKGLAFKYTGYPLSDLPINEADFCSIIGNILDNAIEGTERIHRDETVEPIRLTFSRSWKMFYIFCTNACEPNTIHKRKEGWLTSKESKDFPGIHAIGIRNIERIINSAEGRCSFTVEKNTFHVKVVIPYPFH